MRNSKYDYRIHRLLTFTRDAGKVLFYEVCPQVAKNGRYYMATMCPLFRGGTFFPYSERCFATAEDCQSFLENEVALVPDMWEIVKRNA